MTIVIGYVFSSSLINVLHQLDIRAVESQSIFSSSAIQHNYFFSDSTGQKQAFAIIEVHDEETFLQKSGKDGFRVEVTNQQQRSEPSLSSSLIWQKIIDDTTVLEEQLRLYFQIRKKSKFHAVHLDGQSAILFGPLEPSAHRFLRPIHWGSQSAVLISLGPDCFDLIITAESSPHI